MSDILLLSSFTYCISLQDGFWSHELLTLCFYGYHHKVVDISKSKAVVCRFFHVDADSGRIGDVGWHCLGIGLHHQDQMTSHWRIALWCIIGFEQVKRMGGWSALLFINAIIKTFGYWLKCNKAHLTYRDFSDRLITIPAQYSYQCTSTHQNHSCWLMSDLTILILSLPTLEISRWLFILPLQYQDQQIGIGILQHHVLKRDQYFCF